MGSMPVVCKPHQRCPELDNGAYHGVCLGHDFGNRRTCTRSIQPCPDHGTVVYCDACGSHCDKAFMKGNLTLGQDTLWACSERCYQYICARADSTRWRRTKNYLDHFAQRQYPDEQRGWKLHRWWNQAYKHRRKAFDQWREDQRFKKLQRKLKRGAGV